MRRLLFALPILAAVPFLFAFSWADLRPRELKKLDPTELADRETRGRALLDAAAEAHGRAAWTRFDTMHVVATDTWESSGTWWPADVQSFRADRALGTFTSRVELLDGPGAGAIWGIQDWHPWRGEPAVFSDDADWPIRFYLPTLQYFDELPFRLTEAEHAVYAGRADSGHERVFVTWGALEAHADADQYVVYLDPETHHIDRVAYTIREAHDFSGWPLRALMKPLAVGTIHFRDLREVDGVHLAFDQIVTLGDGEKAKPPEDRVFHRLIVDTIAFDTVAADDLRVDPRLALGSDAKP